MPFPCLAGPLQLFVYLFIYLFIILFNLLSSPRDSLASPAGLGGQGARQGEDSKGHRGLSPPHTHTHPHPILGSEGAAPPSSEPELAGEGDTKMGGLCLLTLTGGGRGGVRRSRHGAGPHPPEPSTPTPGHWREGPPHLFPIYSSSRGTPGSRDRLSPGPRWGLGLLRSRGGAPPPSHIYATLPGRGARAAIAPLAATTSPAALRLARVRIEAHTSTRTGRPSLLQAHTLPHR